MPINFERGEAFYYNNTPIQRYVYKRIGRTCGECEEIGVVKKEDVICALGKLISQYDPNPFPFWWLKVIWKNKIGYIIIDVREEDNIKRIVI